MKTKQSGFTLVEMIITIAITAIVGVALLVILVNSMGLQTAQSNRVMQGLGINDSLSDISNWVRRASVVAEGYPTTPYTYTSGESVLVLKIPSIDASDNVVDDVYDYVVFVVEDAKLKEKLFPDNLSSRKPVNKILTNNIASVVFSYQNATGQTVTPSAASVITATINLSQKSTYTNETNSGTSTMRLRNF